MASLCELPVLLQAIIDVAASPGVGCYERVPTLLPTTKLFSVIYFVGRNFLLQHLCEFAL
jgi:hypothetical protein